jgi:4-amino-4-deoxy-L-arabinose transferase-like glycosyltransferase
MPEPFFPAVKWTKRDWLAAAGLCILALMLSSAGLSIRSLWGPEGRWALIVREMIISGKYFYPTTNGIPDFDKPLLSYWAILPFAWTFGVNELTLRIPSALAGTGVVLVTYAIGRRLFGRGEAFLAALIVATSFMFLFWARTASAEILNLAGIWLMFWAFLSGGRDGKWPHLWAFYMVGAVSSFLKGPVAPAVCVAAIGFYSLWRLLQGLKNSPFRILFREHFRWIWSLQGLAGLFFGAVLFSLLLLLPVIFTGFWDPVYLMFKENVLRFVKPFDHVDPFYSYLVYIPLFTVPWTFPVFASLWAARGWPASDARFWSLTTALGIFLFFTFSGSRRGYYILPILPVLALIAGKALRDWIGGTTESAGAVLVKASVIITASLLLAAGIAAGSIFFIMDAFRSLSLLGFSIFLSAGAFLSLWLLVREKRGTGFASLSVLVIAAQLWFATSGAHLLEQQRTLRAFSGEVKEYTASIDRSNLAIFQGGTASLLFYLDCGILPSLSTVREVEDFGKAHPGSYLIIDLDIASNFRRFDYLKSMAPVIVQKTTGDERQERFVLLQFPFPAGE